MKLGGDQDSTQLDDHVLVVGLGLGAVPRCVGAALGGDVGVVAVQGVPDDHEALGDQSERDGSFDRFGGAVVGFADTGDLFRVFYGDLDARPGGVAGHDGLGGAGRVGGDQGQVVSGG